MHPPMHKVCDDEELIFSRKDRLRECHAVRNTRQREDAFLQKDIGYTEAQEKVKKIRDLLEVFLGYARGLHVQEEDIYKRIARLLEKDGLCLKNKIIAVLSKGIKEPKELSSVLSSED